ncbi:hypothetical protein IPC434_13980 [Pseudomonas aeruginosa]|nr:putative fibrillarin [Pseudomonas paraeruginosa]PTC35289.1 hypothetical protein CLJ1_3989 [Pseudomonas aeruginosa]PHJ33203.1 hypothetical protein CDG78_07635 [Pseudomonas paraeruginosa]RPV04944.1 hypothetical protein IPC878_20890 [Pseudomonas aeruginosa]RQB88793.1 hypothetical protein IPC434_13980 [Pseudomonas aeruginosa]
MGESRGELSGIGRRCRAQEKEVKRGGLSARTTGRLRKGGHDGHWKSKGGRSYCVAGHRHSGKLLQNLRRIPRRR